MQDVTVSLANVPGTLADLGEALGGASINIEGGYTLVVDGLAEAHLLIEDVEKARAVLAERGFEITDEREALSFYVSGEDRPGILGRYARRIAEAGVNIERSYIAAGSRLVFVTSDNAKARAAVKG